MLNVIHEAGPAAILTLLLTLGGAAAALTVGLKRGHAGGTAVGFAVAVMAMGMVGHALGQRNVNHALATVTDASQKLELLSVGTVEASSNLLIAGICATALCLLGGGLALRTRASTR